VDAGTYVWHQQELRNGASLDLQRQQIAGKPNPCAVQRVVGCPRQRGKLLLDRLYPCRVRCGFRILLGGLFVDERALRRKQLVGGQLALVEQFLQFRRLGNAWQRFLLVGRKGADLDVQVLQPAPQIEFPGGLQRPPVDLLHVHGARSRCREHAYERHDKSCQPRTHRRSLFDPTAATAASRRASAL